MNAGAVKMYFIPINKDPTPWSPIPSIRLARGLHYALPTRVHVTHISLGAWYVYNEPMMFCRAKACSDCVILPSPRSLSIVAIRAETAS